MRNFRKIITTLFASALLLAVFVLPIKAATTNTYTVADVAKHNTASDCYMIFENSVYNITSYVKLHDKYMDIRSWCGNDMTTAFKTKDGSGEDHRASTYTMLANYKIGELVSATAVPTTAVPTTTISTTPITTTKTVSASNVATVTPTVSNTISAIPPITSRYNFFVPFLATVILYVITYYAATKGWFGKSWILPKANLFWNSILVISLIPSALFGFFMMFQYDIPALANINFDFLWWHVEGSVIFGTTVICHYIQRFKQYLIPLKFFNRKTIASSETITKPVSTLP